MLLVLLGVGAVLAVLIMSGWLSPELMLGVATAFGLVAIAVLFLFAIHGSRILEQVFAQIRRFNGR